MVFSAAAKQTAAQESGAFYLSGGDCRDPGDSVVFDGLWKYHAGDDITWADPDFDDNDWELASTVLSDKEPPGGWQGIGWFRMHIEVDSAMLNQPLAIIFRLMGASEIYLNGGLINSLGKVSSSKETEEIYAIEHRTPPIITFDKISGNVFAIRYSNHRIDRTVKMEGIAGFSLSLMRSGDYLSWLFDTATTIKSFQMFFCSAALAIALIHLLLFIFYPLSKENLYFAIFALSIAGLAYFPYSSAFSATFEKHQTLKWLFKFSLILTGIWGPRFLYSIFYTRLPKQFWIILIAGIGMLLVASHLSIGIFYIFIMFPLLEMLRVVFMAVIRKKVGARLVASGFAAFILLCIYQITIEMRIVEFPSGYSQYAYLYGIMILLVSISILLARNFARTSKNLEAQLVRVKALSEVTLEQERLAQKQKMEQRLLQAEVDRKEKELEEARKLEKALKELEKAHMELKDTQAKLVHSEKMASLGMLVAGIAHEINTPIAAVNSMHNTLVRSLEKLKKRLDAEFSKDKDEDGNIQVLLQTIDDANKVINSGTVRVTDIVRRLKSFARLDEAEIDTVDIHDGLDDTLTIIHHQIKHRAKVTKKYGDVPPIPCYPGQLNQVFLNLLINAGQAIKDEGEIIIKTYQAGNRVYIEIRDNGIGIPSKIINRIFDPGFTTKGVGVGTGLGLSICYQIIQDHKGEIKVESEVGKGTVFTVILPMDLGENSVEDDK
jgi:signal transduction histidine kinase